MPTVKRQSIRRLAIVAHPYKPRAREELPRLRTWLMRRGIRVLSDRQMSRADAVITLGGDGTILAIAPDAARHGVPVLGVNIGRLGFMTSVELGRLYEALDGWLQNGWPVSERLMLKIHAPRQRQPYYALNDAVIRIGRTPRVASVQVSVDNENLGDFTGDGVIVATPTGSTAYSLAAQGPVLHPEARALLLTPICPHSFRQRPLVMPEGQSLELTLERPQRGSEVQLCLDGQKVFLLRSGDRVRVTRSPYRLKLIQNPQSSYFGVLREKLLWGGR